MNALAPHWDWRAFAAEHWQKIASTGWDSFIRLGRGALVLPADEQAAAVFTADYVLRTADPASNIDRAIGLYSPGTDVLVLMVVGVTKEPDGTLGWTGSMLFVARQDPPPPVVWQQRVAPAGFN